MQYYSYFRSSYNTTSEKRLPDFRPCIAVTSKGKHFKIKSTMAKNVMSVRLEVRLNYLIVRYSKTMVSDNFPDLYRELKKLILGEWFKKQFYLGFWSKTNQNQLPLYKISEDIVIIEINAAKAMFTPAETKNGICMCAVNHRKSAASDQGKTHTTINNQMPPMHKKCSTSTDNELQIYLTNFSIN